MSENETENENEAGRQDAAVTEFVVSQTVETDAAVAEVVVLAAAPGYPAPPPETAEAKPRRRIRSSSLFVGAVVLGVLGGVGTGYAVQSGRPATPLPSLIAAHPSYPPAGVYAGVAPSPLPAGQDDQSRTDGDLTKLLLPTPAGATIDGSWDHEWIGLVDDAALCGNQQRCFTQHLLDHIRALADTGWRAKSGYYEEIRILRYAPQFQTGGFLDGVSTEGTDVVTPADLNAAAAEFKDSYGANADYAVATHGDLVVEFWVTSESRIPDPKVINALMTQQMARL